MKKLRKFDSKPLYILVLVLVLIGIVLKVILWFSLSPYNNVDLNNIENKTITYEESNSTFEFKSIITNNVINGYELTNKSDNQEVFELDSNKITYQVSPSIKMSDFDKKKNLNNEYDVVKYAINKGNISNNIFTSIDEMSENYLIQLTLFPLLDNSKLYILNGSVEGLIVKQDNYYSLIIYIDSNEYLVKFEGNFQESDILDFASSIVIKKEVGSNEG